jgi:aryl-alcohol dehydrogenase-like predicted oxidoreductase
MLNRLGHLNTQLELTQPKLGARLSFALAVEMAAAWTLSFDFVPSTIVGATHPSQLDDTLRASETILSPELLQECDSINQEILYPMG